MARMSPRQRMINLMYIVLTAMLALNVSSDVLNGFNQVQDGLLRTNLNMSAKNDVQFRYLSELYEKNPTKARPWYEKGAELHSRSAALYSRIDSLKTAIARQADGPKGDFHNLVNLDDLEAASVTMLNPASNQGRRLHGEIDAYREYVAALIPDTVKRKAVMDMLSTTVRNKPGTVGPAKWEERMFDNMPAVAAVTILTKLQNDIRQAESEALTNLITSSTPT